MGLSGGFKDSLEGATDRGFQWVGGGPRELGGEVHRHGRAVTWKLGGAL